jgi:hypothetical protein
MLPSVITVAGTAHAGTRSDSAVPVLGSALSSKVVVVCDRGLAETKAEPPFPFRRCLAHRPTLVPTRATA